MKKATFILSVLSVVLGILLVLSLVRYFQLRTEVSELRSRLEGSTVILDSGVATPVIATNNGVVESAARDAGLSGAVDHGQLTGKKPASFTSGTSHTPGTSITNAPSDSVKPSGSNDSPVTGGTEQKICPKEGGLKHTKSLQERLHGSSVAPLGEVAFETHSDSPWSINIFPREYKCEILDMKGPDGEFGRYMKMSLKVQDTTYELKIEKSSTLSSHLSKEWLWNPRLGSSLYSGVGLDPASWIYGLSLGIGLWSYGVDQSSPEYYFAHIGVSYDISSDKASIILYPAMVNISPVIPWTKSTYIGLGGTLNTSGFGIVLGVNTLW